MDVKIGLSAYDSLDQRRLGLRDPTWLGCDKGEF
jgi:hypothetical protein